MIAQLQRRVGRFPIELPAAAALAVAVAFLTVALPDWRFERAVAASGLGNVLSAAQPPLGTTARIVVALVLAALSFLAAWFALRALDGRPETSDFPAFRAADLHPDAPRRRPILAGAEFGAPVAGPEPAVPGRRRALVSEPMPSFLAPQPPQIGDFTPDPEPVATETRETVEEPRPPAPEFVERDPEHDAFAAPPAIAPEADVPSFLQAPRPEAAFDESADFARSADASSDEDAAEEDTSVSDLMARLESGIARHGGRPPAGAKGPAQDELRRAMLDLDRLSNQRS